MPWPQLPASACSQDEDLHFQPQDAQLLRLVEEAMQAAQSLKEQRRRDGLAAGAKGPSTLLDDTAPSGRPGTFYSRLGLRQW